MIWGRIIHRLLEALGKGQEVDLELMAENIFKKNSSQNVGLLWALCFQVAQETGDAVAHKEPFPFLSRRVQFREKRQQGILS